MTQFRHALSLLIRLFFKKTLIIFQTMVDSEEASVDSDEALLEMLGLDEFNAVEDSTNQELDLLTLEESVTSVDPLCVKDNNLPKVEALQNLLPQNCSRHLKLSKDCVCYSIPQLLSKDECHALIELSYEFNPKYITCASHVAPDGTHYTVPIQNPNPHKLSVMEQPSIIDALWKRLHPLLMDYDNTCRGLNPRLRILRYDACDGDLFEPHFDATTVVGPHTSRWTVLIYLNENFEGGETCFLKGGTIKKASQIESSSIYRRHSIIPKEGMAVIFEHDLYHAGLPLKKGSKYVLRTDVMFDTNETKIMSVHPSASVEEKVRTKCATLQTVKDLCQALDLSPSQESALEELEMYDITIQNILLPGVTQLRLMLIDTGAFPLSTINAFVDRAMLERNN